MDEQRWIRLEQLFEQVVEMPATKREAFIEQATGDDTELKAELISLVQHHHEQTVSLPELNHELRGAVKRVVEGIETDTSWPMSAGDTRDQTPKDDDHLLDSQLLDRVRALNPDFADCQVISKGGMGTVFRVHQKSLDRNIAVKILNHSLVDDRLRRRFIRESKAAAKVQDDHVVEIFSVHDDADAPYLVMELIEGPSLKDLIKSEGSLPPYVTANIVQQIAVGLEACHQKRLIHRDVKPSNIIIQYGAPHLGPAIETSQAKLIDFGIAQDTSANFKTLDQIHAGTPAYMSPEQVQAPERVDHRSDIYGLGATMYQMLVGEPPFRGPTHMIVKQIGQSDPTPPRRLDDRIPKDVESICLKALHADPNRRYQTAAEFAADLQRFRDYKPTVARPISSIEKFQKWRSRNKVLAATIGLSVGLLLALSAGAIAFALVVASKNKEIFDQRASATRNGVTAIIDSEPGALPATIDSFRPLDNSLVQLLRQQYELKDNRLNRRTNAAVALSFVDPTTAEFVVTHLDEVFESPDVCLSLVLALNNHPEPQRLLQESLSQVDDLSSRSRRIILLANLGDWSEWATTAAPAAQPDLRTDIIHRFSNWHSDLSNLIAGLADHPDQRWLWTICQALSEVDPRALNQHAFEASSAFLKRMRAESSYYSVRASAEFALTKWEVSFDDATPSSANDCTRLKNGIRMVRIEAGKAMLGRLSQASLFRGYPPHLVEITKPFLIADTETTAGQFREYLAQSKLENSNLQTNGAAADLMPAQMVSWFDAVRFCNWLSKENGFDMAYQQTNERMTVEGQDGEVEIEQWKFLPESNGFRLPTEAQWEFACRYYSETLYHYGNDPDLFELYGLGSQFTTLPPAPVRSKLPNANGLFDMHGNLWEWCQDWNSNVTDSPQVDPMGPIEPPLKTGNGRVYRGGGVGTMVGTINSEARGHGLPNVKYDNLGFRVVLPAK